MARWDGQEEPIAIAVDSVNQRGEFLLKAGWFVRGDIDGFFGLFVDNLLREPFGDRQITPHSGPPGNTRGSHLLTLINAGGASAYPPGWQAIMIDYRFDPVLSSRGQRLRKWGWLIPAAVGAGLFFILFGPEFLAPGNIDWLLKGDPGANYTGWLFFRNDPVWHWPPGLSPNYGGVISSSIVYSDSIPLFALFFKLLSPWLGEPFQYEGLWILLCFILQGSLAWQCARLTTPSFFPSLASSLLLLASVPMIARMGGVGHFALSAHWLILGGFWAYLSHRRNLWLLFLGLAALIHAYLLTMLLPLWLASIWQRRRQSRMPLMAELLLVPVFLGTLLFLAGYFVLAQGNLSNPGYYLYGAGLLSLIDSKNWGIAPGLPATWPEQGDALNYLGTGVLFIFLSIFIYYLVRIIHPSRESMQREPGDFAVGNAEEWWPLALACLLLATFALSPVVTIGSHQILNIPLPAFINNAFSIYRGIGRFTWPLSYGLMLIGTCWITRKFSPVSRTIVICIALVLQYSDIYCTAKNHYLNGIPSRQKTITPLQSPFWQKNISSFTAVKIYPLQPLDPDNIFLGNWAANKHLKFNTGNFSRWDNAKIEAENQRILNNLHEGRIDNDTLYIIKGDEPLAATLAAHDTWQDKIDGFTLLAKRIPE